MINGKKQKTDKKKSFTALYFDYVASGKKSGYGLISEYNHDAKNFIHREMWIDDSKL